MLLELGTRQIIADFMDIRDYGPAVASARQSGAQIYLAPPRIEKPGERAILRALVRHAPDGILVRNLAGIAACRAGGMPFTTDYGLNVTNELSAQHLIGWGAERVTASYDLNRDQLLDLAHNKAMEPFDRSIDMHVSHLRKKLESGRELIKTIRGVGYQFSAGSDEKAS